LHDYLTKVMIITRRWLFYKRPLPNFSTLSFAYQVITAQWAALAIFGLLYKIQILYKFGPAPKSSFFGEFSNFGTKFVTQKEQKLSFKTREKLFWQSQTFCTFFISQKVKILPTVHYLKYCVLCTYN